MIWISQDGRDSINSLRQIRNGGRDRRNGRYDDDVKMNSERQIFQLVQLPQPRVVQRLSHPMMSWRTIHNPMVEILQDPPILEQNLVDMVLHHQND